MVQTLLDKVLRLSRRGNVYCDTSTLKQYYVFNDHDEEDLAVGVREAWKRTPIRKTRTTFVPLVHQEQVRGSGAEMGLSVGRGLSWLAYRMLLHFHQASGEYLDIHAGGIDNAFPHHTNEIAQSESYLATVVNYWFHVHHLNTNNGKMSKSKGEFLTVSLLEQKGLRPHGLPAVLPAKPLPPESGIQLGKSDNAVAAYDKLIAKIAALKG